MVMARVRVRARLELGLGLGLGLNSGVRQAQGSRVMIYKQVRVRV